MNWSAQALKVIARAAATLSRTRDTFRWSIGSNPVMNLQAGLGGPFAGFREADGVNGAKAHLMGDAVHHVPKQPGLCSEFTDLEVQVVTIGLEARLVRVADGRRTQFVAFAHVGTALSNEQSYAQI
jgi:hypothetical protein